MHACMNFQIHLWCAHTGVCKRRFFKQLEAASSNFTCARCPSNSICNGTTDSDGNIGGNAEKGWHAAPPYPQPGFWMLDKKVFRSAAFSCYWGGCEGGGGNKDGNSTCEPGYAGRICSQVEVSLFGKAFVCAWMDGRKDGWMEG